MLSESHFMIDALRKVFRHSGAQNAGTLAAADCLATGLGVITALDHSTPAWPGPSRVRAGGYHPCVSLAPSIIR